MKNYPGIPAGCTISAFVLQDGFGAALKFALSLQGTDILDSALGDLCKLARAMMTAGFGVSEGAVACDAALQRVKRDVHEGMATTTITGSVSDQSSGLSSGAIAGIVIGVLLGLALVIGIIAFVIVGKNRSNAEYNDYSSM